MAKSSEQQRLEQLLAKTDKVFRDAFGEYVRTVKSPKIIAQITDALERNDLPAAEAIIRSHIIAMGHAIPLAIQQAGLDAAAEATRLFRDNPIAFAFDPSHPRAAELIRQERLGFIKQMTDSQLDSIRVALSEGFEQGQGAIARARRIKDAIGLTTSQLRAVDNYRGLLTAGSAEALNRELRDRRFDRTVRAAQRQGRQLNRSEIDRMVERYRQRYIDYRAEMIARTEGTRATSVAREETYRQLQATPGLTNRRILRVWNATRDSRTRDWHESMQGQVRPIGQAFQDGKGNALMYPGDASAPGETVIHCRCVLTMRLEDPQD